jgi:hypothetical protein
MAETPFSKSVSDELKEVDKETKLTKLTQIEAGYLESNSYFCEDCIHYIKETPILGTCSLVAGIIRGRATCNFFKLGPAQDPETALDNLFKLSKEESGYLERPEGTSCSKCLRFIEPNSCDVVMGTISPSGCCNQFIDLELIREEDKEK